MPTAVRTRKQQDRKVINKQSTAAPAAQQKSKTAQQLPTKTVTSLSHDQALMNLQQSNTIVKTMLDATFGCMTFLRGLLPEGNFDDVQIAAPNPGPESRPYKDDTLPPASQMSNYEESNSQSQPKGARGLRIKKIKRGYSTEADKLLDWIDVGIAEAVEKQYLKACVFAVYLDPEDPSNLVEALTINFHYPELADTGIRIPQFDIEESIHNLKIGGSKGLGDSTDSARGPDGMKLRTIGEVKRAIKKLIKSLIITCQSLGELPSRRWVTMRLEYLDETPAEYEPPFFVAANANQKLHFDTKDASQVPDKTAIGHLETGFHSLSLKLTSITEYIPRTLDFDEEEETYGGFGASGDKPYSLNKKRRADEAALRSDAAKRRVVWDALDTIQDRADIDPAYQDAEGEPDSQVPNKFPSSPVVKPVGIRQADGTVKPYVSPTSSFALTKAVSQDNIRSSQLDPTYVSGRREAEPEEIQDNDWQMDVPGPGKRVNDSQSGPLANGPAEPNLSPSLDPVTSGVFQDAPSNHQDLDSDTEMVDTASKDGGNKNTGGEESIGSFDDTPDTRRKKRSEKNATTSSQTTDRPRRTQKASSGKGQKEAPYRMCPCAAPKEDETMVECEECATWYHMPCAGYLDVNDLPEKYICIICRMATAGHFSENKMSEARSYLPSLTLERRALTKMYKKKSFESVDNIQREIGCDKSDIFNLLKRFQDLGFLRKEVKLVTRKVNKTASKELTITTFHVQDNPKILKRFKEYFEPGGAVEMKAFGITPAMLEKGYTVPTAKTKKVEDKTAPAPVEKENVVPNERKNTRAQAAKMIALPKPSKPANIPPAPKPVVAAANKEGGQPTTEMIRPMIPLPKSKPKKQQAGNPSNEQGPAAAKGLFRTAASIVVPTTVHEEVLRQVAAPQGPADKAPNQGGVNKASAPEEDVDMGV